MMTVLRCPRCDTPLRGDKMVGSVCPSKACTWPAPVYRPPPQKSPTAVRLKYSVIKERGDCSISGARIFIEQTVDRDNEFMWIWHAVVPRVQHGSLLINPQHLSGDMVLTRRMARSAARKAVAQYLLDHPQKRAHKDGSVR